MKLRILSIFTLFVLSAVSVLADEPPLYQDGAPSISGAIIVNGRQIEAPLPYIRGDEGNVMVPLSAIARELGISVEWRRETRGILLGGHLEIWPGQTQMHVGGTFTRNFGPAPEIIDGHTFVSLPFFGYGLNGFTAQVEYGNILINTAVSEPEPPADEPEPEEAEVYEADYSEDIFGEAGELQPPSEFARARGVITEIREFDAAEGSIIVSIEDSYLGVSRSNLIIDSNTILLLGDELEIGTAVIGFYDATLPSPLIYPPRHRAVVVSTRVHETQMGRFDGEFLRGYRMIYILPCNETEIVFQSGEAFYGDLSELEGRAMIITHDPMDMSVPFTITPEKIIILFERD